MLSLFLSIAIGIAGYYLAAYLPQPIAYQGIHVGDIGAIVVGYRAWLTTGKAYGFTINNSQPLAAYPFTAMVVLTPLLFLPLSQVYPVFCALSSGLMAWGLLKYRGPYGLLAFVSFPYVAAVYSGQWAPLFVAALLLPEFLPFAVGKPQMGIPLLLSGRWEMRQMAVALVICCLSVVVYPTWLWDWLRDGALDAYEGWLPILTGIGPLLGLAVLFWRGRSARL